MLQEGLEHNKITPWIKIVISQQQDHNWKSIREQMTT